MDGLLPRSMDICHQYLMVLARDKQWEQALDFFSQLVDRARPAPDQNCYDAVLYGLNRAERWVETVEVMDVLRQRLEESPVNVKPRRRLYLSALSTLLKVVSAGGLSTRGRKGEGGRRGRDGWVTTQVPGVRVPRCDTGSRHKRARIPVLLFVLVLVGGGAPLEALRQPLEALRQNRLLLLLLLLLLSVGNAKYRYPR